jgi:creatinine amidohydrolase
MTDHFLFENLTWPEVAELNRETSLVLPLGDGYDKVETEQILGSPSSIGWLPALPYGWQGSGLEVPEEILSACIANLVNCLIEDGFQHVFVLHPVGVKISSNDRKVTPNRDNPIPRIDLDTIDRSKVILIPIGHTEQHALHLPLNVDTLCIEAVMEGTVSASPRKCSCLPVFPYGVSTHRNSFPGTFNMGGRAFEDFFLAIVDWLNSRGFQRIYLNSGHGGNVSFLVNVVKYSGERHPEGFCATTWLYLNGPEGAVALEELRDSKIGGMGHACELETSLMIHLRPELVHMERVVDEIDFISSASYSMEWNETGALVANPPWKDDTLTGAYGAGSLASAEKGAAWLQAAIREKMGHVEEIIYQHSERVKKRKRKKPN